MEMDDYMNTKFLLTAALVMSILLLGCAALPQQPAAQQQQVSAKQMPAQNPPAIAGRTGANVENPPVQPQPPPQQQKQYTCALTLAPPTINAGSSTEVGFSVQTKDNVVFTYNCGNEIREISTGGLTTGFRLCQFDTPGSADVWIKADGVVCAQKTLTVLQPLAQQTAKTCYIDPSSVKRDLAAYYYEARVQFSGFSPQDKMVWICDRMTATKALGGEIGGPVGMPLYSDIYCDFGARPAKDAIEVSIGNVSCGSIPTR